MTAPRSTIIKPFRAIPSYLVYEIMDGKPVYYQNYKKVLRNTIQKEKIMGYGLLQWVIINLLTKYFNQNLSNNYFVLGGEGGIHLSNKDNLSLDFAVFETAQLNFLALQNKYIDIPPKLVIEVDTKAETESVKDTNYYTRKTQKLLDFGVSEVIWIFTETHKIWLARPNQAWLIINWNDDLEALGIPLNLQQLLDDNGIKLENIIA
jgi:Uma2 family endonuclease